MLRQYLDTYTNEKPFPESHYMSEIWERTRNKLADRSNSSRRHIPSLGCVGQHLCLTEKNSLDKSIHPTWLAQEISRERQPTKQLK